MRVATTIAALMLYCLAGMMDYQALAAESVNFPANRIAPPSEFYSTQRIIINWDGFPNSGQLRDMFNDGSGGQIPIVTDFTWEAIGPEGGVIPSLAIDPQDPTHIYATTYGFPGSIYVSTNSGQNWQMLGIIRDDIYHITIDPTNHNIMYVTSNDGLYKSTDGGVSWNYGVFGANLSVYTAEIKVDPQNPNILYAAGSASREGDSYGALAALKSTNGGATWQANILTGFHQFIYPGFIDMEPTNPNNVFLGGQTTDGVSESYLLFRTTDAGNSWFDSDSSKTIYRTPFSIAFDPSNSSRIYVGTYSAVFTSTDGGKNWTPNTSAQAYDLLVDPLSPNVVYATYNRSFKSTDYGVGWNSYANYLRGYSRDLQMINSNEILWSGWCGVFKTQDAGVTWNTSSTGLVASEIYSVAASRSEPNVIYACSFYTGIYKSTDYGTTWGRPFGSTYPIKIVVDVNDSRHLILSDGHLSESTDGGGTWQGMTLPEDSLYVDAISVNPATMDTIWFMGFNRSSSSVGMYKSVNRGQSWSVFYPGQQSNEFVDAIEVDPTNNNIVFAGIFSGSSDLHVTYRTTDGGTTWENVWSDTNNWITSYAIDPSAHNRIYAASWKGLYKSTDMGNTWSGPVGSPHIYNVIVNPNNTAEIFAGTYSNGIDHSINHGASWEHIGNDLTIPSIRCLEIGWGSNQYLYAGTEGGGIYRTALTTGVADNGSSLPGDFVLYGNYPNPFNAQTTIKYDIARASDVSIDIYDLLGRKVGTIAEGVQQAGSHEATWNAGAKSSGVYLYKISAGSHSDTRKMLLLK